MTFSEFREVVSKCDFLRDGQKDQLMVLLDEVDGKRVPHSIVLRRESIMPIVDNVYRRTRGIGLDSLPVLERLDIEHAVCEMVSRR